MFSGLIFFFDEKAHSEEPLEKKNKAAALTVTALRRYQIKGLLFLS